MTVEERKLIRQTAVWATTSNVHTINLGLESPEALRRADEFLRLLSAGQVVPRSGKLDDSSIDVLHAACRLLSEPRPKVRAESRALFEFVSATEWPMPDFDERSEILSASALAAWRAARRERDQPEVSLWRRRIKDNLAQTVLETPIQERLSDQLAWLKGSTEGLLAVCNSLRDRLDSSPVAVRGEAEFFYFFLKDPKHPVGLFDEREYLFGELALIAGTACRILSRREEARLWFGRAEHGYCNTVNSRADLARLGYQRLALQLEERRVNTVIELVLPLIESFQNLGMPEDVLKCRFLQGLALLMGGRVVGARDLFSEICKVSEMLGNQKLLAAGLVNLTHAYALLGDSEGAIDAAQRAMPLLRITNDRVGLAKIQWGLGTLLRAQGRSSVAIEIYRASQRELRSLEMRADIATLRLAVADALLEIGQDQEAIREILVALPVIHELKMLPEGVAALSLLRESVRHQKIDRKALRELRGCFEQLKG